MINTQRLNALPKPGPIVFFRSCMTTTQYPEAHTNTVTLLSHLGFTPVVVQDQTCCLGFSYFGGLIEKTPMMITNARIMALFASYAQEIATVCNACFSTLNYYQTLIQSDPALAEQVNSKLKKYKLQLPQAPLKVWHLLELLYGLKTKFPETPPKKVTKIKA